MGRQRSIDPATGRTVFEIDEQSAVEVDARLAMASHVAPTWRALGVGARAHVLERAGSVLHAEREAFGALLTREMGKTYASALAEVDKCAATLRYYAEHAVRLTAAERVVDTTTERGDVRLEPLGAVLAVMPWNFPLWQVIRFAAPALLAGNVGLLKHASNVPRAALALHDLFRRAGAPDGVFSTLLVGASRVEALIADPRIHAVTLTGSESAGRAVGAAAGRWLKKAVLELGGSDPFVVCASADLDESARVAALARCINNGQSCIAAKRFIVVEAVASAFMSKFRERLAAVRMGDPMDPHTELGPLVSERGRAELHEQVEMSVQAGALCSLGGQIPAGAGFYYPPTILESIPRAAPAWGEELFGPVALVHVVPDFEAALALSNATRFGLGASVWTKDPEEAERASQVLEAGSVFVNGMVASDPRFPFGGVKASGYGRELGRWGLAEFVNVKTVRAFDVHR